MEIKQKLKNVLGYFGVLSPATLLWRMLTPQGRALNERLTEETQLMMQMFARFVKSGDLCFDVGANIGAYTDALLKLNVRVIAVEPQPACIDILQAKYRFHKSIQIVPMGLAEKAGEYEFMISNNQLISSMSKEWTSALKQRGGKFAQAEWTTKTVVPVTTLDLLIKRYGTPTFCKIDVEGFEYEVLKGLSQPIQTLSLEFTPEFIQPINDCVNYLSNLGSYEFNYSLETTMQMVLSDWVSPIEMCEILSNLATTHRSGDVYACLTT
jgi:FkbM family methyltransferase